MKHHRPLDGLSKDDWDLVHRAADILERGGYVRYGKAGQSPIAVLPGAFAGGYDSCALSVAAYDALLRIHPVVRDGPISMGRWRLRKDEDASKSTPSGRPNPLPDNNPPDS